MNLSKLTLFLGLVIVNPANLSADSLKNFKFCPELELSEDQVTEIKQLRKDGREEKRGLKKALRDSRRALRSAKREGDAVAIEQAQQAFDSAKNDMKQFREARRLAIRELLDENQQQIFDACVEKRKPKRN